MLFITGATGSIGRELCQLLAQTNKPARAMCRREDQLAHFRLLGLEAALADVEQPKSLRRAMQGCERMFLLTAPTSSHTQQEMTIIDAAVEAGITSIVRLSTADTNLSAKLSYAKSHAEIDHYVRSKPLAWTLLRPTGFMQNFLESAHPIANGLLPHMMGDGQLSYIDSRDIALVAKQVLTEEGHQGATYYLTGSESLTVKQVAALFTHALGYEVNEMPSSEADMRRALGFAGLSDWHIDSLIEQFKTVAGGYEIDVTEEVQRLTRQPPRTFAQFVQDYKDQFFTH